ncbi:MAG: diguanylate cyclase, partial [Eubacteriales bacterium]|nr:diguanylate cyclase [Eubacteriales bacterium]
MELSYILSLIIFGSLMLYFFQGLYIYSLHHSSALHRMFFLVSLSLCIWAFTYSVANCAPNYETCLFWRRLAVFGWGFVYSFLLHFIIILTEQKEILQKRSLLLLLYGPCLVNIYANFFNAAIVEQQFELVKTYAGWINLSKQTPWDLFFYCYYTLFTIVSIFLLWQWTKKINKTIKQRQARFITASYVIALAVGSLAELVINSVAATKVPQIGIVIIMLPYIVMFFSIIKYDLLPPAKKEEQAAAGMILSEATSSKMYRFLAFTYIFGAFFSFALHYFFLYEDPKHSFLLSVPAFLFGSALYAAEIFAIPAIWKNRIQNTVILLSIPVLNLLYISYGPLFGWIFPVIILFIAIVSGTKHFVAITGCCIVISLLYTWVLTPSAIIKTDGTDHLIRILVFLILIWIAHFIKEAYVDRLVQYQEQVEMQKLNAAVSAGLVSVNEHNIEERLKETLLLCGEYLGADHAVLSFYEEDALGEKRSYEWQRVNLEQTSDPLLNEERTKNSIPITSEERIIGTLVFSTRKSEKNWNTSQWQLMQMISNHLTDVWLKISAEKELKKMAYFDNLTNLPNRMQFSKYLKSAIDEARETNTILGVIYLDLDFFKTVNDLMGHDSGDELLKQFSFRLTACLREEDTIARFGGDEFLIMLPRFTDIQGIQQIADRIIGAAREPLKVSEQELFITSSMGIAVFPYDGETPEDLIKNADLALYTSKENGRSKYTLCSQEIKKDFVKKNELTSSLYLAMERNEFLLYYQPKVDPEKGNIVGVEALLRWQHPEKGLV